MTFKYFSTASLTALLWLIKAEFATKYELGDYLTTSDASSTYLTQTNALSTYATKDELGDYLTTSDASSTYLTQTNASSTYATKDELSSLEGLDTEKAFDITD